MKQQSIETTADGVIITFYEKKCTIRIKTTPDRCSFTVHKNNECLYNGHSMLFSDVLKEVCDILCNL